MAERRKRRTKVLTFPTILVDKATPLLEAVSVPGVRGVADVEEQIIEEGLESRDRSALLNQEG